MQSFKTPSFRLSDNTTLKTLPEYFKIVGIIESLVPGGTLQKLQGNCVASAELICSLLDMAGIPSRIVECQLTIKKNSNPVEFYFVGFDNVGFKGELDTHLVVITETEIPILIDCAVGHYFEHDQPVIIEQADNYSTTQLLSAFEFGNYSCTYKTKKTIKLPSLHQKNILDRIQTELKFDHDIKLLKKVVIGICCLSFINFALNAILIILKLMWP
jgi:hypothetical protein